MGVRLPSVATTTFIAGYPASGVETVAATTPPLNISLDFGQVILLAYITFGVGTGTTAVKLIIRRGTTTAGVAVNTGSNLTTAASNIDEHTLCAVDTPGAVAGQQYSLTIQGVGTTGGAVAGEVALIAFAL